MENKNIHILPTDKPSKLYIVNSIGKLDWSKSYLEKINGGTNQNIYITSDEEIKDGDYFYQGFDCIIHKCYKLTNNYVIAEKPSDYPKNICKKIILTTDQDLIKDGVQAIPDEFLEWFVMNNSCEEVYFEFYNNQCAGECGICNNTCGKWYKLIIPKEKQKKIFELPIATSLGNTFTKTIKVVSKKEIPEYELLQHIKTCIECNNESQAIRLLEKYSFEKQQERYSEEDVLKLLILCKDRFSTGDFIEYISDKEVVDWFEQYKKK